MNNNGVTLSKDFALCEFALIGLGGLGCNIAVHLAGLGVKKLHLCDFDTVSESNLNRQFLYRPSDIGLPKTERAEAYLHSYAPDVVLDVHPVRVAAESDLAFAERCDMIFLAADNNAVRKIAAVFCEKHGIPLVNGGINGHFGTAYLYVPGKTPCPFCAGILQKENSVPDSVSSVAGIIGALEAEIGTEYIRGQNTAGILYIYDDCGITRMHVSARTDCPVCRQ